MRIIILEKNYALNPALKNRIEKKVNKLGRYFKEDVECTIKLSFEKPNRNICEVTIPFHSEILRTEETRDDMYYSVDRALAKVERQIHKYRTRLEKRLRENAFINEEPEYAFAAYDDVFEDEHEVVRHKTFAVYPMNINEAIDQMELLGHNFFVFLNERVNDVSVVYKRDDGKYGLIDTTR